MADPLSVLASTASLVDICIRLVNYLRDVEKAVSTINEDIASLIREIEALNVISKSLQDAFKNKISDDSDGEEDVKDEQNEESWKHVRRTLENCQVVAEKLEAIVKEMYGKSGPSVSGLRDSIGKAHRKRSRDGDVRQCRDQLATYQNVLQILLAFINIQSTRGSQKTSARSFDILTRDIQKIDQRLGSQISALQNSIDSSSVSYPQQDAMPAFKQLRRSVTFAAETITAKSANKHFDIPQAVSSIFTGREASLENLKKWLVEYSQKDGRDHQRRFVIHGLGGSGKTQFCSKFAEDNRESFWGVFWIDASTIERIKQTYASIAKIAGVEPNENAAMHWLSNLEQRWLLVIDNADDPRIGLEQYFPKGNRGHILVTTRNPAYKMHGNVGPGYYEFEGLNTEEANHLLLKAARQPTPWDSSTSISASTITKKLGFLALAIVHAGALIRDGLCSIKTYLSFYNRSWERLRRARAENSQGTEESTHHMYVYTTWEMCYQRIESKANDGSQTAKDAVQLLSTFSFLHWENIQFDIFRRAIENPIIESKHQEKEAEEERRNPKKSQTISQRVKSLNIALIAYILKNRSPTAIPVVIRDARAFGSPEESFDRIRYALKELVQLSLVAYNEAHDSYSMHPIVSDWARERPAMRLAEQALWSEAAANLLCASLLIPPIRNNSSDEDFLRNILPHIIHVQSCRDTINGRINAKLQQHWTAWFVSIGSQIGPQRAIMSAKFSLVYAHNGYFAQAAELLSSVRDYLAKMLGPGHERTRRVCLFLAEIYWNMSRGMDAERLQRSVLDICLTSLGPKHLDTLRVKNKLGQTLWQQGRYSEARELQEEAFQGLDRLLGRYNEDTLNAMDNLAGTIAKFWEREHLEQAYAMHKRAINGMEKVLGPTHLRTLWAKENIVRTSVYLGGDYIAEAESIIKFVMEERKKSLGKEHPFTLLAMCNTAIVKSTLGDLDEAESLILTGLPIAERNLGENHIGTLLGCHTLGSIRIRQQRYAEAEEILQDVSERHKFMLSHRGDFHPDRLGIMIELAKCYRLQNKVGESIRVCDETLEGFASISKIEHPLARDMKKARMRMIQHQERVRRGEPGDPDIAAPSHGTYSQFSIF